MRSLALIGALATVLALAAGSPAHAGVSPKALPKGIEVTQVEGPFSVVLDENLKAGNGASAIAGPDAVPGTFLAGQAVVSGSREAAQRFADSVGGKLADSVDTHRLEGVTPLWLVRFDPANVDASTLDEDLAALSPDEAHGVQRVSDKPGLATLAAAAHARRDDLEVGLNWLVENHTFRTRSTADAPGSFPGDEDAFGWSSLTSITVPEAWNMLARAGRIAPGAYHPRLAVIDGGFSPPDADRAPGGINAPVLPNPNTCTGGKPCPNHGSDVASVMMAVPDNKFGGAGPAGPVATPLLFTGGTTVFDYLNATGAAVGAGARVINMSFGTSVPAIAQPFVGYYEALTLQVRALGVMEIASAGNDGADIDKLDCFGSCWEGQFYFPCENAGVECVGGLAGTVPATGSNYGSGGIGPANSVDLWAPFCALAGPNVSTPGNATHDFCGTSAAAPLVSGVAGLALSAASGAPANAVEPVLVSTAKPGGCLSAGRCARRIADASAAVNALLGNLPPDVDIRATTATDVPRGTPITFRATATDPEGAPLTISWFVDGDTSPSGTGTTFTPELRGRAFGSHTIRATVSDTAWTVGDSQGGVTVSTFDTAPAMTIVTPVPGQSIVNAGSLIRLCRLCSDDVRLSATSADVNNQPASLPDAQVSWYLDGTLLGTGHTRTVAASSLALGPHTFTVTGTDDGHNTGRASVTVNVVRPIPIGP
jgi:hypothetical protein